MKHNTSDTLKKHLEYLDSIFTLSMDDIYTIIQALHSDMKKGLTGAASSLQMLPAFIAAPTGREKGRFLALDLGGTNFRVLAVDLLKEGKTSIFAVMKFVIPQEVMQGTGQELFDFIAESIQVFFEEYQLERNGSYDLAFTFSFPVSQTKINAGTLIKWTKGFTASGVEGRDVMTLLQTALANKNITYIRPVALVNDTVGTLVSKCYSNPSCDIGVILGTGMNACYLEQGVKIKKLPGNIGSDQMIINMECGNFDKIPQTPFDLDLDRNSPHPGAQKMEKMVSGMYLGEIMRIVTLDLMHKGILFDNVSSSNAFSTKGSIETRQMSAIATDNSPDLQTVAKVLADMGINNTGLEDRVFLKHIGHCISKRSATIAATAISAIVTWMDPDLHLHHTVGVDGSLYEKYPGYQAVMNDTFSRIFKGEEFNISLELAKDGSGKGAAIIAAMASTTA